MLRINRLLTVLLLAALLISACQPIQVPTAQTGVIPVPDTPRFDTPTYGVRGPYAVGVQDFVIESAAAGQRSLPVSVWYPALNPDGKPEAVTYTTAFSTDANPRISVAGRALVDAAPDPSGGAYPLVVYSHAGWAWRQSAPFLLEHLASHGFVVISADHEDNWGNGFDNFYRSEISRPQDISREIDFAATLTAVDGKLAGLIDTEQVAVTGHSFGGAAAMEIGGARLNLVEHQEKYCVANPNDMRCGFYADKLAEMAELAGLDAVPEGPWPDWRDPRVDVVMPLEPGEGTFGVQPATLGVPVLLMEVTDDPPGIGLDGLSSEQETGVIFENAAHFIFQPSCRAEPAMAEAGNAALCSDPVWDMDRAHDLINHFATAFLLAELKGDAEAAKALAPENVAFPGIQYETTVFGN